MSQENLGRTEDGRGSSRPTEQRRDVPPVASSASQSSMQQRGTAESSQVTLEPNSPVSLAPNLQSHLSRVEANIYRINNLLTPEANRPPWQQNRGGPPYADDSNLLPQDDDSSSNVGTLYDISSLLAQMSVTEANLIEANRILSSAIEEIRRNQSSTMAEQSVERLVSTLLPVASDILAELARTESTLLTAHSILTGITKEQQVQRQGRARRPDARLSVSASQILPRLSRAQARLGETYSLCRDLLDRRDEGSTSNDTMEDRISDSLSQLSRIQGNLLEIEGLFRHLSGRLPQDDVLGPSWERAWSVSSERVLGNEDPDATESSSAGPSKPEVPKSDAPYLKGEQSTGADSVGAQDVPGQRKPGDGTIEAPVCEMDTQTSHCDTSPDDAHKMICESCGSLIKRINSEQMKPQVSAEAMDVLEESGKTDQGSPPTRTTLPPRQTPPPPPFPRFPLWEGGNRTMSMGEVLAILGRAETTLADTSSILRRVVWEQQQPPWEGGFGRGRFNAGETVFVGAPPAPVSLNLLNVLTRTELNLAQANNLLRALVRRQSLMGLDGRFLYQGGDNRPN